MTRAPRFALDGEGDVAAAVLAEIVDRAALGIRRSSRATGSGSSSWTASISCGISSACVEVGDRARRPGRPAGPPAARRRSRRNRCRTCRIGRRPLVQLASVASDAALPPRAQLGDGADLVAPGVEDRVARPHHLRAVPAVAEPDVDGVLAGLQQVADVVGLVGQPLVVAGPAGRQQVVADALAVDEGAVEAERADPQRLGAGRASSVKVLRRNGCLRADAPIGQRADHLGRPGVGVHRALTGAARGVASFISILPAHGRLAASCAVCISFYVYRSTLHMR